MSRANAEAESNGANVHVYKNLPAVSVTQASRPQNVRHNTKGDFLPGSRSCCWSRRTDLHSFFPFYLFYHIIDHIPDQAHDPGPLFQSEKLVAQKPGKEILAERPARLIVGFSEELRQTRRSVMEESPRYICEITDPVFRKDASA